MNRLHEKKETWFRECEISSCPRSEKRVEVELPDGTVETKRTADLRFVGPVRPVEAQADSVVSLAGPLVRSALPPACFRDDSPLEVVVRELLFLVIPDYPSSFLCQV